MVTPRWRMIVCDLDGTLIDQDHQVLEADRRALVLARDAGLHVAVCTGRSLRESAAILKALPLSGLGIFVTGAAIGDMAGGPLVLRRPLEPKLVLQLIDFFGRLGHAVLLLIDDGSAAGAHYVITSHGPVHAATTEWLLRNRLDAAIDDGPNPKLLAGVVRVGIVADWDASRRINAALRRRFNRRITFHCIRAPRLDSLVVEVFASGVNKWTGVEALCRLLRIDSHRVVTIGNDLNDLPMLRRAALSFAMGDASQRVKNAAKRVTGPHQAAGVAAAIDQVLANPVP
jgi:hydroxymethylpyrimidine pyrophosphatase-like HAD family hydrolase